MRYQRVLGLSLGSRKLGIAILERYSLFDCHMKCYNRPWSTGKLKAMLRVIGDCIEDHRIGHLGIKVPPKRDISFAQKQLVKGVESLACEKSATLYKYSLPELKMILIPEGSGTKKVLMEYILKKYPDLKEEYYRDIKNKYKHYDKLFESVAAAHVVMQQI